MSSVNSQIAHFYHLFAGGSWQEPAGEHFAALAKAGFEGEVHLGLVGSPEQRREALAVVSSWWPGIQIAAEADSGFEQVTLRALRLWAARNRQALVLYAHSKGAGFSAEGDRRDWHRRAMTHCQVGGWRDRVAVLEGGETDAVGCHWLTREAFPGVPVLAGDLFAGNYWWASSAYLADLPDVGDASRYEAEGWIGTGAPRVKDTSPQHAVTYWNAAAGRFVFLCPYGQDAPEG